VIIDHQYFHVADSFYINENNTSFPGLKHPLPAVAPNKKVPDKRALSPGAAVSTDSIGHTSG